MNDNKLDPPETCSISKDSTEQLKSFCSSFEDHTTESDLLHTLELPISPSQDLFGEPTTSSSYRDSPPIGRTTVTTPSCLWKNCESSINQVCVNTDSGFSSWTGRSDSKTKSPSNLITSDNSIFMLNQSDQVNFSWRPTTNLNESDVNSNNLTTNSSSCLSNLPCASELNEELSDRMFITSISDMMRNSPTWSTPWNCANKYTDTYEPCKPVSQSTVDMTYSYPETIPPSDFSPFYSLGLDSVNQNANQIQSPNDTNDKIYKSPENFNSPSSSKSSYSTCIHERNPSNHLFRPIPNQGDNEDQRDFHNSSNSSFLINTHHDRHSLEEHSNENTNKQPITSLTHQSQYTSCHHRHHRHRPRTVSYTAYLDSSFIKKSYIYRPGSAPLHEHENLFIPEEQSDSSENNQCAKEIIKSNSIVYKRHNKKSTLKLSSSTRRFSQNYQANSYGHCSSSSTSSSTDKNKIHFENVHTTKNMEHLMNNNTNRINNHPTIINMNDQQFYSRINLTTNKNLHQSTQQCLTHLPQLCSEYRIVQNDVNCSITAHTRSCYSPNCTVPTISSLPNSPMLNTATTTTNNLNELSTTTTHTTTTTINSSRPILQSTTMPDVVPRLSLHINHRHSINNNNNTDTIGSNHMTLLHHRSHLLQPRCSSVPLVQSSTSTSSSSSSQSPSSSSLSSSLTPSTLAFNVQCQCYHCTHQHYFDHCQLSSNYQSQSNYLLARRLAYVADELMLDYYYHNYSRRNYRSMYNLVSYEYYC
ncbi:unnamed protein product [Schistosoma turkestanicum]|nr:unnamed protein product [Schistosoma turkestanicum]